jgi:carboxylate-amine ligase
MKVLEFKASRPLTFGIELELQVLHARTWDLVRGADDLLNCLAKVKHPGEFKPEITESMIEYNSSVHECHAPLLIELCSMRDVLARQAGRLNLAIAGGGTHPFHAWHERRIYPGERFQHLSALYGYLAKQFTVFGQHIHIGCASGDDAIYLTHQFSRYIPHFIALSAASPFSQGHDTLFETARLHAVSAFPLSGHMPPVQDWAQFNDYFGKMSMYGIIASMKDFYWDIRPKPEYGTVEIRICDTPLDVKTAAALAAYAQALAAWLLAEHPHPIVPELYDVYGYNRFQACRFGFHAAIIDPFTQKTAVLEQDIDTTLTMLAPYAVALESTMALQQLRTMAAQRVNGAAWLRAQFERAPLLKDVVQAQAAHWQTSE